jgi:hypothetical protein
LTSISNSAYIAPRPRQRTSIRSSTIAPPLSHYLFISAHHCAALAQLSYTGPVQFPATTATSTLHCENFEIVAGREAEAA